ncbi:MAG: helix-hairpin-helix domain-containing protein, partial [Anaerolineales bacterium]|nr:helix-hairpin-helix domain-containing protein [Anaerolineales bacterium]
MTDFLNFLNTADLDTLTQVNGVTRQIAGNLIAARPFNSVEECLQVKGMGKTLLAKLQTHAEALEIGLGSRAMVPVQEEAMPALMEKTPPAQESPKEQDSFFKRLGRAFLYFLRALVRLIMLAILIVSVGALFYFGLPYIQDTFIAPVERNTEQIQNLEDKVAILQSQVEDLSARVGAMEDSVEAHSESIGKLEEMQATLEAQLEENNDKVLVELKHEVMFTRALDILARARLYLAQSNFGLAKLDVQTARALLAELQAETDDDILAQAITRLDMALGNLPDFPVVASGDLEIAWQILISGNAPAATPTFTFTPTPAALGTFTPTPPAAESPTATIEATFTPTPFDI